MELDEFIKEVKESHGVKESQEVQEDILPPEEDSKLKKVFLFIISILLVILMLSYIFASYPVSNIIAGWLESEPLQENIIGLDGFSIVFEDKVREGLQQIYFSEQKVEFSVCLLGEKKGKDYYIDELYLPKMYGQSFNHVSFEPCSPETLIVLHSHPYKSCLASSTDLDSLEKNKAVNPDVLMVVMCEPERFSLYN